MKGIKSYMIAGILFVSVLGTLLHFAYAFSGDNFFVGLFTPVNESTWEHTKLIYFPMLVYSFYLNKKLKGTYPCIYSATLTGGLLGVLLIIALFYTYTGIIGFNVDFVNIAIFLISVIIAFYVVYKLTLYCKAEKFKLLLQILNIVMIYLFIHFTYNPPGISLFANP